MPMTADARKDILPMHPQFVQPVVKDAKGPRSRCSVAPQSLRRASNSTSEDKQRTAFVRTTPVKHHRLLSHARQNLVKVASLDALIGQVEVVIGEHSHDGKS